MAEVIIDLKRRPPEDEVLAEVEENETRAAEQPLSAKVLGEHARLGGLYFVCKRNPFNIPMGRWFRRFDDGYEEVIPDNTSNTGRFEIAGYRGFVYPHDALGPFLQKVRVHGVDSGAFRAERRRRLGD